MLKIGISIALFTFTALANAAGFTVFDSIKSCEIARDTGHAKVYSPTTKAPFQGGNGWTKKTVPAGGACLGQAHVLEDGAPKNGKAVFVAEGFVYWEHTSGAFRMHDCSNPFGQIAFGKMADKPATTTAICDDCNKVVNVTSVTNITEIVNVRQVCTVNGQEVAVVNGQCPVPTMTVALPVKVEPATQVAQPACATCTPTLVAQVLSERTAKVCGIEIVASPTDRRVIGRLQLDDFGGKIRIARVEQFEGTASQVSVSPLPHSLKKDCNEDHAAVYKHWQAVVKKFGFPDTCVPQMVRKTT
jgi:hypothetical protein